MVAVVDGREVLFDIGHQVVDKVVAEHIAPEAGLGNSRHLDGFREQLIRIAVGHDNNHLFCQTLCQQTDMEDADGIKIWENDILRLSPFGKPESQYTGDVVWMQTCFAVEDDRGHHEPLSTLRNLCKIEVIGNRYDEG